MNETPHDLSLTTRTEDVLYTGIPYERLFKVKDELKPTGVRQAINVTVAYNITHQEENEENVTQKHPVIIMNDSFTVTINSYTTVGTGSFQLNETGTYTLCGRITNTSESDTNTMNDVACANFTMTSPYTRACNASLALTLTNEQAYYEHKEKIQFKNVIAYQGADDDVPPFIIEYRIRELPNGAPRIRTTENTNQKQYTPSCPDKEWCVFEFTNTLSSIACNNTVNETGARKLVIVQGNATMPENDSRIDIIDTHTQKGLVFGEQGKLTVKVYRGNTKKYAVKAWVETVNGRKVSTITTFYAKEPFTTYDVTLPFFLKDSSTYKTGYYLARVEGLDEEAEERMWLLQKESILVANESVKPPAPPRIQSFYTRSTKAQEVVNVYALVKSKRPDGKEYSLRLESMVTNDEHVFVMNETAHAYQASVKLFYGPNPCWLTLYNKNGTLVDQQRLFLEMDDERIKTVEEFSLAPKTCDERTTCTVEENKSVANVTASVEEKVTGAVTLYEGEKTTRFIPFFFLALGLLLALLFIKRFK